MTMKNKLVPHYLQCKPCLSRLIAGLQSQTQALLRITAALLFLVLLGACSDAGGPDSGEPDIDIDGGGGVVGTGLILQGTASDQRSFANNSVDIKAFSGERSITALGAGDQFSSASVAGTGPYLLRTNLGNGDYRYGISYGEEISNINSYSDIVLRNWYALTGQNLDDEFDNTGALSQAPSKQQYLADANNVFAIVGLVLDSYGVSGEQILSGDFDADNQGVDLYLDKNPIVIDGSTISVLLTDLTTKTQSFSRTGIQLGTDLSVTDVLAPSTAGNVRVLGSGDNEIVAVWDPAVDDGAIVGYKVFRDGVLRDTTPFPVYTDTGLAAGTQYTYEIVAVDTAGNESLRSMPATGSTQTGPDTVAPPAPPTLIERSSSSSQVGLIWGVEGIADIVGFKIYRGSNENALSLLVTVTSTIFTDTTVAGGSEYCYQVTAIDASDNESGRSPVLCVNTSGQSATQNPGGENPINVPVNAGLTIPDVDALDCSQQLSGGVLTQSLTLASGCYTLNEDLVIGEFVNLTLTPGTTIKFAENIKLLVPQNASLTSNGSAEFPVVLTGVESRIGYWDGVVFDRSNNAANLIRHTVMQYGGDGGGAVLSVNSNVGEKVRIRIENSLFRFNDRYGLSIGGAGSIVDGFTGNVITGNVESAAFHIEALRMLGGNNDLSGNDFDSIDIGGTNAFIDVVIHNLGIPYTVDGLNVLSNAKMTISAGVEIQFNPQSGLFVDGTLQTNGTESSPVLLTAKFNPDRGQWLGVYLTGDGSSQHELNNTVIEYGGGTSDIYLDGANLYLKGVSAALNNVTLSESAVFGFFAEDNISGFTEFNNVTVSGNAKAGLINIAQLQTLSSGSSLSGNDVDQITVNGSELRNKEATWTNVGIPYFFFNPFSGNSEYEFINAAVTIEPGVEIVSSPRTRLIVSRNASLNAVGTPANPVVMRGEGALPGYWGGLVFQSNSDLNQLEYVLLQDAGGDSATGIENASTGAVRMECSAAFPARLSISKSEIANSASWGLFLEDAACNAMVSADVSFSGNALGDINTP